MFHYLTLIKMKGPTIFFCLLLGLLVSEALSHDVDNPEEELSSLMLRHKLLMNRYRRLCNNYSNLATNCSAPVIECTECPDGWIHVGEKCFLVSTDRQNWSNSSEKCTEIGGHLAILTTKEEHEALEHEGRRIGGLYTYYWIGLNDIETEGEWKWVDNSEMKTPFWNTLKSEPDNHPSAGEEGEDCAVLDSYNQEWFDVPCSFMYPRICQMDAKPLQ